MNGVASQPLANARPSKQKGANRAKPAEHDPTRPASWVARTLVLAAIKPWVVNGLATLRERGDASLELRSASGETWRLGENGIMREA